MRWQRVADVADLSGLQLQLVDLSCLIVRAYGGFRLPVRGWQHRSFPNVKNALTFDCVGIFMTLFVFDILFFVLRNTRGTRLWTHGLNLNYVF